VTTLQYGLSNARVETVNTRIRLLTRIAFGFHSAKPLIAMVLLALGGLCPPFRVGYEYKPTERAGGPENNAVTASSNDTPCASTLAAALAGSHSKVGASMSWTSA
jgi:hypothetical protein